MDEPFGALDIQTKESMQQFTLDLWKRTGISILMITHDVQEAVFLAQRIYVMTARPGTVRAEVKVELGGNRDAQIRQNPRFKQYQSQITTLLTTPVQ